MLKLKSKKELNESTCYKERHLFQLDEGFGATTW